MPDFATSSGAWYWMLKGDAGRVYSSAATGYVPVSDSAYVAWREAGGVPTPALDEADLFVALVRNGLPVPGVPPAVRKATTYALLSALTDAQRAAYPGPVKAWDQRMFSARDTPWPETNEKIARIAAALGTTPAAWFDAALKPAAG